MDYHDSSAGNARLAVAKYAATSSEKLGTIFFIPGAPFNPSPVSFPVIPNFYRWTGWFRSQSRARIRTIVQ